MNKELTIIVPVKNEENYVSKLFESLLKQDYEHLRNTKIYIADAQSTDGTLQIVEKYKDRLMLEVVRGGLPSEGRNAGARRAKSRYLLFLDADIELGQPELIRLALDCMKRDNLHCVTTRIRSRERKLRDELLYTGNLLVQFVSRLLHKPFCPGAFMLFDSERFRELGGFNESVAYAEDYYLSRNVEPSRFRKVPGFILTSNRRFKNMGYFKFLHLFFRTVLHSNDDEYFLHNHSYWNDAALDETQASVDVTSTNSLESFS